MEIFELWAWTSFQINLALLLATGQFLSSNEKVLFKDWDEKQFFVEIRVGFLSIASRVSVLFKSLSIITYIGVPFEYWGPESNTQNAHANSDEIFSLNIQKEPFCK